MGLHWRVRVCHYLYAQFSAQPRSLDMNSVPTQKPMNAYHQHILDVEAAPTPTKLSEVSDKIRERLWETRETFNSLRSLINPDPVHYAAQLKKDVMNLFAALFEYDEYAAQRFWDGCPVDLIVWTESKNDVIHPDTYSVMDYLRTALHE